MDLNKYTVRDEAQQSLSNNDTASQDGPTLTFFDSQTYSSDVYNQYDNVQFSRSALKIEVKGENKDCSWSNWREPFSEVPEELKNNPPIYCDHGGLVIGCALNSTGNRPLDIHMVECGSSKSSEERNEEYKSFLQEKRSVLSGEIEQWKGGSGWNWKLGEDERFLSFEVLQEYLKKERPDCISASRCFVFLGYASDEEGLQESLSRDEVEKNYGFYRLEQSPELRAEFQTVLEKLERGETTGTLSDEDKEAIKSLPSFLQKYVSTYRKVSQDKSQGKTAFKIEDVMKDDEIQSVLGNLDKSFSALKCVGSEFLMEYVDDALLCIKNLKQVNIDGRDTIRCLHNTSTYRKERINRIMTNAKDFESICCDCDNKNIALFSVDALYHHYGFFVHGLSDQDSTPNFPLDRCVDSRLVVLPPKDTVLFSHSFDKLVDVPDSYKGLDGICLKGGHTGISGIVPQLSGAFIRARMIDSDVHPKEFLEILKRSGSISLTKGKDGIVYGGVVPDFEKLEQNVHMWKKMRLDNTPYAQMSLKQKKERAICFNRCLYELDLQTVNVSYFRKEQSASEQEKHPSEIVLQQTEKTTYGAYFDRSNTVKNSQIDQMMLSKMREKKR